MLFGDLVGFTSLAEHRDPEEVKRLVDRMFQRLSAEITAFGGVIDKLLGDGIVALFGAPVAHEDDAERAVRAGLRMQETLAEMCAELELPVQLRVGVNTGEVLVGTSISGGDYTAMGDVMNSAARLEGLAEPGQVMVGETTYQATKEAIGYDSVGRLEAKGRVEALDAYVARATMRPPGVKNRRTTDFVGRDLELDVLHAQARLAIEQQRAQTLVVLGEAGIGKSRLVEVGTSMIASQWGAKVLEGRSVPYGEANVWWPVAEVVRQVFGIGPDQSFEAAGEAVQRYLDANTPALTTTMRSRVGTSLLHVLGYATSLRGGERNRNRAEVLLGVTLLIEAELRRQPLVVVLSDCHWAAQAIFELINHLMRELSKQPLLVFVTARTLERSDLLLGRHGSLVLQLGSLGVEAARGLVAQFDVDLPDEVVADLVDRADGNPYFLEELSALVATEATPDQGAAVAELASGRLERLPDTLRGIVSARLDALDPGTRTVLEGAALLGRTSTVGGLRTLMSSWKQMDDVDDEIDNLVAADLIELSGSRYQFRSDMVRDVAYGTLTKAARALGHLGIARYLEDNLGTGMIRNSGVVAIATHYARTAELLGELRTLDGVDPDEVLDRSLHWLGEAGWRALAAGVPLDAEEWFSLALRITDDDDHRANFLYGRARARSEVRNIVGTRRDIERLGPLVADDRLLRAKVLVVDGDADRAAGDLDRAADKLREAATDLEQLDDLSHQSLALRLLGLTEGARDDDDAARAALHDARAAARKAGDRRAAAWATLSLGLHLFRTGRPNEAGELAREADAAFTALDDGGGRNLSRGLQAWVAFHGDDWDTARELIDEVLPETRRRGDPWAEALVLQLDAALALWAGQAGNARDLAARAYETAERAEDVSTMVTSLSVEGRALVSRARLADGSAKLQAASLLAERANDAGSRRAAAVVNAASAARVGEPGRVLDWWARHAALGGNSAGRSDLAGSLGDSDLRASVALAHLQLGDVETAAAAVSDAPSLEVDGSHGVVAAALVDIAAGDLPRAEERAATVLGAQGSYLDRVHAHVAIAAIRAREWDVPGRDKALAEARAELSGTDDLLTPRMLDLAVAVCSGDEVEPAVAALGAVGVDADGWLRLWRLVAGSDAVSQAAR